MLGCQKIWQRSYLGFFGAVLPVLRFSGPSLLRHQASSPKFTVDEPKYCSILYAEVASPAERQKVRNISDTENK
jgi:hypothetical protein